MDLTSGRVYIDANILIYVVEGTSNFAAELTTFLEAVDQGLIELVTSEFTLAEVLVGPIRSSNAAQTATYETLLSAGRFIDVTAVDREVLRRCAEIRAPKRGCLTRCT
jgi:predicted nucleic acid-binding protein